MTRHDSIASDIQRDSWILRAAPGGVRPYMRLARMDRPIGTWLLLLPCWWGLALATEGWPDPGIMGLFAVGAFAMRGAGCTINDIVDRDFDAKVARTATRPLPSGEISVRQAVIFLVAQLTVGLAVLFQFKEFASLLAVSSLGLVFLYPFAKRVTQWPQFVLGLTFNWGALVGWAVVHGDLHWPAVALYAGGVFWTLGYDTIYAHQDKEDDEMVGVKSSALALGDKTTACVAVFYALTTALICLSGYLANVPFWFYIAIVACGLHFLWQVYTVNIDEPDDCKAKFQSNRNYGLAVFAVIVVSSVYG